MSDDIPLEALRKRYRLVLNLGKYRVTERYGNTIKIALGGTTTMTVNSPVLARSNTVAGEWLTLYTEVEYANPGGYA